MKKKMMVLAMAALCGYLVQAAVVITVTSKTVQKTGGGGTITVVGTGAWTAVSDSDWVTVKSGASGEGDGTVMFTVGENTTADTRIGHINITGGNVFTITQYGYTGTISPTSTTCNRDGKTGVINVTADAGITWSATPNVDWITVTPTSGRSVGAVTYTVAEYNGVVTRNGTITIAGRTFNVTQTGVDVNLEPKVMKIAPKADIVQVTLTALASTKWVVKPNATWISVLDKESGYGDYVVSLAVNANPSFARRTGTVSIGTAILTVIQDGKETAQLAIDPEYATASPSGAYGNVAVYATPDAPWTAQTLTPWLVISQGQEGAGNGNIKYIVSPNPTTEERAGIIKITPPYKEPEVDLYAGLECWMPSFTTKGGTAERYFIWGDDIVWSEPTYTVRQESLNTGLPMLESTASGGTTTNWDGISAIRIDTDTFITTMVSGPGKLTFWWVVTSRNGCMNFMVDGLDKMGTGNRDFWSNVSYSIGEDGNHDVKWGNRYSGSSLRGFVDYVSWESSASEISFDGSAACCLNGIAFPSKTANDFSSCISFSVDELNRVNRLFTFAGESVYLDNENRLIFHETPTDFIVDSVSKYYTLLIRQDKEGCLSIWCGSASGMLQQVLAVPYEKLLDFSHDVPTSFLKLGYATSPTPGYLTSGSMKNFKFWSRALTDEEAKNVDVLEDVIEDGAPKYAPSGSVWNYFPLNGNMFSTKSASSSPVLQGNTSTYLHGVDNRYGIQKRALESLPDGNMFISDVRSYFGGNEPNATYSMWFYINKLPSAGTTSLMRRYWSGTAGNASTDLNVEVSVLPSGAIQLNNNGSIVSFDSYPVLEKRWYMITLVGVATQSLQVYLDDTEIGNVSSGVTLGYSGWGNYGNNADFMRGMFGAGACAIDDLVIYHQALTSAEVRELYEASKAKVVYHKVLQGIQTATLSETNRVVAAEGANLSVQLTLAQNVNWTAVENCDWIHITSDKEGAGSATISFTVDSTPLVVGRTGSLTIAGVTLTIEQVALDAYVDCEKTFFDSVESDMGVISVYTEGAGQWTAVSNDDWIHIDPESASGSGTGDCWFFIDDYPLTTRSRTGSITIAGRQVFITQSGYTLSIDPVIADVGSNAGAGEIGVAASIDQVWEVITDCDWIKIVSGRSGIGNGKVQYQYTDNTTGELRTGTIIIGGQEYTLIQRTTLPLVTKANGEGTISGAGQYDQGTEVTLTATPKAGNVFSHWQGDAVGVSNKVTIVMDISKNVEAVFIPEAAADQLVAEKAAKGGFYTRDQIHNLEVGNLILDVDATTKKARVGVKLQQTSDISHPEWKPVEVTTSDLDVGKDGTVGIKAKATGNGMFYRVVVPKK